VGMGQRGGEVNFKGVRRVVMFLTPVNVIRIHSAIDESLAALAKPGSRWGSKQRCSAAGCSRLIGGTFNGHQQGATGYFGLPEM
jgi:hypothetical protein